MTVPVITVGRGVASGAVPALAEAVASTAGARGASTVIVVMTAMPAVVVRTVATLSYTFGALSAETWTSSFGPRALEVARDGHDARPHGRVEGVAHLSHIRLRRVDDGAQVDRRSIGEHYDRVRAAGAELGVGGARDDGAGQEGA